MIVRRGIAIGVAWLSVLLALLFIYPPFSEKMADTIPYAFLLLAPFGLSMFLQLILIVGVSCWAIQAMGWNEPVIRKIIKYLGVMAGLILVVHVAWVLFVLAKGGL